MNKKVMMKRERERKRKREEDLNKARQNRAKRR
jgi:hypothetical protein